MSAITSVTFESMMALATRLAYLSVQKKGLPKEAIEAYILKATGGIDSLSAKEYIYGRRRRPSKI